LPDDVETIADLVNYLSRRDARHAAAFGSQLEIRCAVSHEFADLSSPIQPGDEVAFSPLSPAGSSWRLYASRGNVQQRLRQRRDSDAVRLVKDRLAGTPSAN
jgi:molybdopterin converting factor small subunit